MFSVRKSPCWLCIWAVWFHWGNPSWEPFSLTATAWASVQVVGRFSRIMLGISSGTSVIPTPALFHFTVTIAVTRAIKIKNTCAAAPLDCYLWNNDYHQKKGQKIWLSPNPANVGTPLILHRWAILANWHIKICWVYAFFQYYYYDTATLFFQINVQDANDDVCIRKQQEKMSVEGSNMSPWFWWITITRTFYKNYSLVRMSKRSA